MSRHAVCYTATAGHMFQTALSAVQARAHTDRSIDIYVCFFGDSGRDLAELRAFHRVCEQNGVEVLGAPRSAIHGLHPIYGRLFLDRLLPANVDEVLYLDGDTQVIEDISPLVHASPPAGGILASRDPMVFIRRADVHMGRKIEGWWNEGDIPTVGRDQYVNSGVLRITRASIGKLRSDIVSGQAERFRRTRFPDQDAINISLRGRIETISMSWNFPGFLLDTQIAKIAPPRIIHFMSDPRPWNAALPPWPAYHAPYRKFVLDYPELSKYWTRFTRRRRIRYMFQQRYKSWAERRIWQSAAAARAVRDLESVCRPVVHPRCDHDQLSDEPSSP